jgi:uncharacterized protein YkwD
MTKRGSVVVVVGVVALLALVTPAPAIDLNGYRAQHRKPPLQYSAALSAAAQAHAYDMARRGRLGHKGWRQRLGGGAVTAAENVSYGCDSVDCAIRRWARSPAHRRNMLMGGVSAYGIGSAVDARGRRYWVLELGH